MNRFPRIWRESCMIRDWGWSNKVSVFMWISLHFFLLLLLGNVVSISRIMKDSNCLRFKQAFVEMAGFLYFISNWVFLACRHETDFAPFVSRKLSPICPAVWRMNPQTFHHFQFSPHVYRQDLTLVQQNNRFLISSVCSNYFRHELVLAQAKASRASSSIDDWNKNEMENTTTWWYDDIMMIFRFRVTFMYVNFNFLW